MYGESINLTEDCMLYGRLWSDEENRFREIFRNVV